MTSSRTQIAKDGGWQVRVDTGGTFTDCLARDPRGQLHRVKVLSSSALRGSVEEVLDDRRLRVTLRWDLPDNFLAGFRFRSLTAADNDSREVASYDPDTDILTLADSPPGALPEAGGTFEVLSNEEAPVLAARLVTRTPAGESLPPMEMRLATTRGTNALLERRGVEVAFFVTRGFADIVSIGTQARTNLFALSVEKPAPLYTAVVEVDERVAADGSLLRPLQLEALEPEVERLVAGGLRVAAVALLSSYRNPTHEQELASFLRSRGFEHVSTSAELAPLIKILPRAQTAIVNAYLAPVIGEYLHNVETALTRGARDESHDLRIMTSAGGLVRAAAFQPRDSLLSGPAGGVGGAALAGRRSGFEKIIAFDMGGTSTDVSRYDGDFEYVFEHAVGDAHLVSPALAIETVAAGGGSICTFDGQRLRVGPESAGAFPGPASYGAGGPLSITDVNLLLGRLDPLRFELPLSLEDARLRLTEMRAELERKTGEKTGADVLLDGFLDIANERMADAIRQISLRRGYDPSEYALVSFGGAGAQHACAVATRLGMDTVIVPEDAGLLSAHGLGHAVVERFAERQILEPLHGYGGTAECFRQLEEEATAALVDEGVSRAEIEVRRRLVFLRFVGQDSVVEIEYRDEVKLEEEFHRRYQELYGHTVEGRDLEIEALRVVASSRPPAELSRSPSPGASTGASTGAPSSRSRCRLDGQWQDLPVYERANLPAGASLTGPALIFEAHSATVIEGGWRARVDGARQLLLTREPENNAAPAESTRRGAPASSSSEAVRLELFTHRFAHLAEEMGERLRQTAISTNVKERLDFSCALLNPRGELVVNAPHIPVHLGALGVCLRHVRAALPMETGDVIVTNHPAFGGSHLPDVTVITPVFEDAELLGYVANRSHHAEIGGIRPGSMPPGATSLAEEGVVIAPRHLIRRGKPLWDEMRALLCKGPFPSRAVDENLADLRAAVAANHCGAQALMALAREHGRDTVWRYMDALESRAERHVRDALRRLADGRYEAREELDDGTILQASLEISGDHATVDFAGTSPVHAGNLNATEAIVRSVVLYVLRLLIDEPLPLNEGLLHAVDIRLPAGLLNPTFPDDPTQAPAVVGGNVETSQRLAGTLLKAIGIVASSQGTMNNVLFGNDDFGYYETVCGGCGAGPSFDGASAVHSHMTNTRITDAEVLEHRYPVRLERFAVRRGSGGVGKHRGGDGVVREIRFLAAVSLSVLTQHRKHGPYGLAGGHPGKPGAQRLVRASGEEIVLGSIDHCEAGPGDRLILETPGGGGYGEV